MKRLILVPSFVLVALAVGILVSPITAQAQSTHRIPSSSSSKSSETFAVVQIGEEYRVVSSSAMKNEKKRVEDDNKEKAKLWEDAKKSDPTAEKPAKLTIKILKSGFKTYKGANDYLVKLKDGDSDDGSSTTTKKKKKSSGSSDQTY